MGTLMQIHHASVRLDQRVGLVWNFLDSVIKININVSYWGDLGVQGMGRGGGGGGLFPEFLTLSGW